MVTTTTTRLTGASSVSMIYSVFKDRLQITSILESASTTHDPRLSTLCYLGCSTWHLYSTVSDEWFKIFQSSFVRLFWQRHGKFKPLAKYKQTKYTKCRLTIAFRQRHVSIVCPQYCRFCNQGMLWSMFDGANRFQRPYFQWNAFEWEYERDKCHHRKICSLSVVLSSFCDESMRWSKCVTVQISFQSMTNNAKSLVAKINHTGAICLKSV